MLDNLTSRGKEGQKVDVTDNSQNAVQLGGMIDESDSQSLSDHFNPAIEPEGNPNAVLSAFMQNAEAESLHLDHNSPVTDDSYSALNGHSLLSNKDLREPDLKNHISNNVLIAEDGELNAQLKQALTLSEQRGRRSSQDPSAGANSGNEANVKNDDSQLNLKQVAGYQHSEHLSATQQMADDYHSEVSRPFDRLREASRERSERVNIEFRDLRTGSPTETSYADPAKGQVSYQPVNAEFEIPVDLKLSSVKPEAGPNGQSTFQTAFEDALARELRGGLSADIIRNATIIAKDGGEGIIRLALRPASLGDVKIHLEMTENKITGLIVVESSEALRAFGKELSALEKAFRDSGFSEANLEMFLQEEAWNFANGEQQEEDNLSAPPPPLVASRYEESEQIDLSDLLPGLGDGTLSPERTPVNLLV